MFGGLGGPARTVTSGQAGGWVGYAPYVDALYHGFDTALYRMLLECQALGGDGVVGVRLEQRHLGQGNREFVALGTAVRAAGDRRPARLFSTTLNGQDFAKLFQGGWMPASVVVGISVAIRHDDWATEPGERLDLQHRGLRLHRARQPCPGRPRGPARQAGPRHRRRRGDHEHDAAQHPRPRGGESHTDHVAESRLIGDAVVRFHAEGATPPKNFKILPLSNPQGSKR